MPTNLSAAQRRERDRKLREPEFDIDFYYLTTEQQDRVFNGPGITPETMEEVGRCEKICCIWLNQKESKAFKRRKGWDVY